MLSGSEKSYRADQSVRLAPMINAQNSRAETVYIYHIKYYTYIVYTLEENNIRFNRTILFNFTYIDVKGVNSLKLQKLLQHDQHVTLQVK